MKSWNKKSSNSICTCYRETWWTWLVGYSLGPEENAADEYDELKLIVSTEQIANRKYGIPWVKGGLPEEVSSFKWWWAILSTSNPPMVIHLTQRHGMNHLRCVWVIQVGELVNECMSEPPNMLVSHLEGKAQCFGGGNKLLKAHCCALWVEYHMLP